ncbi:MAG TPA: PQQ-binding-like beta-propeller repeat protein, partial [Caulifigura sp.]|nr:PQQ-binding-like beta-propeller repeat protein [Caulifigura sp.]
MPTVEAAGSTPIFATDLSSGGFPTTISNLSDRTGQSGDTMTSPPNPADTTPRSSSPARTRLWPLAALLIAHYAFVQTTYTVEMAMFTRFMSRLASTLLVLIVFLVWWLRNRNFRWSDRLLAMAMLAAGIAVADVAGDPTINLFGLLLVAVPLALALGIALLYVVRGRPMWIHRLGFAAIMIAVFGLALLVRWDGLDGRQQGHYSWRWTPTGEQKFMAERSDSTSTAMPAPAREVALQPGDWAGFRGGEKDGAALSGPLGDWKAAAPAVVWKHRVGPSWSSISIVDGMAITQEQRGDEECVVAYDATTGQELWVHADKVRFDEPLSGAGPRATPAFCDGRIYTSGGKGRLNCLDASNGAVVWTKDLIAGSKGKVPNFGSSTSPLVVDHLIIAFAGGENDQGLFAFDSATGKEVWRTTAGTETFSSPQLATLQGVRQVLMHDNSGLFSVSIDDGKRLWLHPTESSTAVPMLQPHVLPDGDIITGWSDGIARFAIARSGDSWTVSEKWKY